LKRMPLQQLRGRQLPMQHLQLRQRTEHEAYWVKQAVVNRRSCGACRCSSCAVCSFPCSIFSCQHLINKRHTLSNKQSTNGLEMHAATAAAGWAAPCAASSAAATNQREACWVEHAVSRQSNRQVTELLMTFTIDVQQRTTC
jgi:hypothetical protein